MKTIFKITTSAIIVAIATLFLTLFVAPSSVASADSVDEESYFGISYTYSATENFSYATKTTQSHMFTDNVPAYFDTQSRNYTCAPVAAANLIGYYDRYFPALVPDIATGYARGTKYLYYPMSRVQTQIQALINDLAVRMGTTASGTSQSNFEIGLSAYVTSKNLNVTYTSVTNSTSLSVDNAIAQLENGNPIVFFANGVAFTTCTDSNNSVELQITMSNDSHIFVAFGYQKVTYYDAGGNVVREYVYFKTASGEQSITGYYLFNYNGTINAATAVHIG